MSVTSPVPDENGFAFTAVGRECFYCYGALQDPSVHWMGHGASIYLHPDCISKLFVRLARDVHETECPDHYREIREALRQFRGRR